MTDKEKLEKIKALADKMYSRMAYLTSDTRPIREAMEEYHQFIINEYHKEEPVSEPQVKELAKTQHVNETCQENGNSLTQEPVSEDLEKELARLLKDCEIDSEYIHQDFLHIVANHFADWQKERMMKDAIDTVMVYDDLNDLVPGIEDLSINGYTVGDKVKVIVIKED